MCAYNRIDPPVTQNINWMQPQPREWIQQLKQTPRVQSIRYPAGQVLLYEGHYAPGHFLFLKGRLELHSSELEETRELLISSPLAQYRPTHSRHGAPPPPKRSANLTELPFYLLPDAKQIELCFPYTLTLREDAELLYIPRSLGLESECADILHTLTMIQDNASFSS